MNLFKRILPDIVVIILFAVISFVYFFPAVTEGRILSQHDSVAGIGAGEEAKEYLERTGERTRWTNSIFGGMPTYQMAPSYDSTDTLKGVEKLYHLYLPNYVWYVFVMLLGFYILLRAFDFSVWLASLGAVLWAFSSYFFIIIAAGHIWKFVTLAYIPPTIAGMVLAYRGKYLSGGLLTAVFVALQIVSNHVQMSYYFLFVMLFMAVAFGVDAWQKKEMPRFLKATGVLLMAGILGVCINLSNLYHTYEYSKETMRGKSELVKPDSHNQTKSGLERDYITQWSYGIGETFSLLVPNMMQRLGERIDEEEQYAVKEMHADRAQGEKVIPVLFEEMDGIWLHMQNSNHRKMKKQEMKVFTMYEGWDKEQKKRSSLVEKTMLAGMESSQIFHEKREALIEKKYNADEIQQRILNGDGGSWIRETYDPDAIFQLDRYHIYQEILRKISDRDAQREARKLFEEEKITEFLEFILVYADSVETTDEKDKRSQKARELYHYLNNNKDGLLPYQKQGRKIPEPREGIVYKNMGVQESQNCTVITMRMKHRRMRWSAKGANNLAKVLCCKENKELCSTIERYTDGLIFHARMNEVIETLSAAKAPKKDGK